MNKENEIVELRFCHEAAKSQDLSIPAVQATALTYGEVYRVSAGLAATLLSQGGWEAVEQAGAETTEAETPVRKSRRNKADDSDPEPKAED